MQLKLKRSQRTGGMLGGKLFFMLDAQVAFTQEEEASIQKYKLSHETVYDSEAEREHPEGGAFWRALSGMSFRVSFASLKAGQQIECQNLDELLAAEQAIRTACQNVRHYLDVAATFDGREEVVEF